MRYFEYFTLLIEEHISKVISEHDMDLNYSQRNEVRNELKRKLRPDLVNAVRKNDDEILGQLMSALQEAFSIGYDSKLRNQVSNYLRNISETTDRAKRQARKQIIQKRKIKKGKTERKKERAD